MKTTKTKRRKQMVGSLHCKACNAPIDSDYDLYLCEECLSESNGVFDLIESDTELFDTTTPTN